MPTMSLELILDGLLEIKQEAGEKDEVIRDQQLQLEEMEEKIKELESHCRGFENKIVELTEQTRQADDLMDKLSQAPG